jgi:RNA:NAD 2'-phosphotransferase (TPT1/KptA family)
MSKDLLAIQFENLIRSYDSSKELDEKDYQKISKLFSAVIRTSPEIREMFFEQVKEFSAKMRRSFNELNNGLIEEKNKNKKIDN